MVLNATFNNISVISWRSVLLVAETRLPGKNHRPVASHWQTLSHNVVHLPLIEIRTHNISGGRHWLHIGSCKSNYHTNTVGTAPPFYFRLYCKQWAKSLLLGSKQLNSMCLGDFLNRLNTNSKINKYNTRILSYM